MPGDNLARRRGGRRRRLVIGGEGSSIMVYTTWHSIARAGSGCQPLDLRQSVLDTRLVRSARRGTRRAKERQRPEGGGVVGAGVEHYSVPAASPLWPARDTAVDVGHPAGERRFANPILLVNYQRLSNRRP